MPAAASGSVCAPTLSPYSRACQKGFTVVRSQEAGTRSSVHDAAGGSAYLFSLFLSPGNHLGMVLRTPLSHSHLVIRQLASSLRRKGGDSGDATAPPWMPTAP